MGQPVRTKIPQATLLASADDTEQQFYESMQQGDIERLMACWADDDEVACVSLDGVRLHGLGTVRQGFESMLVGGGLDVRPVRVRRTVLGGCAIHHVLEQITVRSPTRLDQVVHVVTTNVFVNTAQGWRMVLHHASPGQSGELDEHSDSQFGGLLH